MAVFMTVSWLRFRLFSLPICPVHTRVSLPRLFFVLFCIYHGKCKHFILHLPWLTQNAFTMANAHFIFVFAMVHANAFPMVNTKKKMCICHVGYIELQVHMHASECICHGKRKSGWWCSRQRKQNTAEQQTHAKRS